MRRERTEYTAELECGLQISFRATNITNFLQLLQQGHCISTDRIVLIKKGGLSK